MSVGTDIAWLQAEILQHIPLARAMQLSVVAYTGDTLEMAAPLAPNGNDKGCAFGGSLASLMTLAAWGLVELGLRAQGFDCDVYVGDSQLRYRAPVRGRLRAVARLAQSGTLPGLVASVRAGGKGHVDMACDIAGQDEPAATLAARYFARVRR